MDWLGEVGKDCLVCQHVGDIDAAELGEQAAASCQQCREVVDRRAPLLPRLRTAKLVKRVLERVDNPLAVLVPLIAYHTENMPNKLQEGGQTGASN